MISGSKPLDIIIAKIRPRGVKRDFIIKVVHLIL